MVRLKRIGLKMKILEIVGVAHIVEKMVKNRLRWFRHVEIRLVDLC